MHFATEIIKTLNCSSHVDIGCGTGELMKAVLSSCPSVVKSVGIDIAPDVEKTKEVLTPNSVEYLNKRM